LSWKQILEHLHIEDVDGVEDFTDKPIERECSSCRYRQQYNKRELTVDQKNQRSDYNKKRRDTINQALKMYREANKS